MYFNMDSIITLEKEESDEIIHYKKFDNLRNLIINKNPNMIVHGVSASGKTFLIEYIFEKLFGNTRKIIEDKVSFKGNKKYYIFDFSNHLKHLSIKKINSIVKNYDHFNDTIKYIIIDNYNNIPDIIQKNMKVFLEKYSETSRFILITNKLFSIDPSIRSCCFSIKINEPNKYDKYIYFKYLLDKSNVKYSPFLLFKQCEKYGIEHLFRLYYDRDIKYENIYERTGRTVNDIMHLPFNINEIKKLSMNIKELKLGRYLVINSNLFRFYIVVNSKYRILWKFTITNLYLY